MSYEIDFGIWGSIFPVPSAIADKHLKLCTGEQLKVLLLALRDAPNPVDVPYIAKRLGLTPTQVCDGLDYWQSAGVFSRNDAAPRPAPVEEAPAAPAVTREEELVAGQKITTVHSRARLTPTQQNRLAKEDKNVPELLEMLQGVLNRPLTPYETESFLYLYTSYRLPVSYLLMAAQYAKSQGKDNLRYLEKLITSWVDRGIDTHDKAEAEIRRLSQRAGNEGRIKSLFGIADRELSAKEKEFIDCWFSGYGYDTDMIKLAYDRTVDNTGKVAFPYLNKILGRWYQQGVRTPAQAAAEMEGGKKETASRESSYDLDEIQRLMAKNTDS